MTTNRLSFTDGAAISPLVVKPKVAMQMLSCEREKLYRMLNNGDLASFRDGGSRKITVASIEAYIARKLKEERTAA